MHALEKLYRDELADLYDAENQILKALPKLIEAATAPQLKTAFERHQKATENQVRRLEQIFEEDGRPAPKKCKGMAGLLAEGDDLLKEDLEPSVMDAALIGAAQRVEHYEIAAYGTVGAFARQLGKDTAVGLLQEPLDEEKEADALLTQIAQANVNEDAEDAGHNGDSKRQRAMASSGRIKSGNAKMTKAKTKAKAKAHAAPPARRKTRNRARSTSAR